MGLRSATAINVATMVGAGPFITLPLVVTALHGSVSALAWAVGALIALCDGLVWAELASRYPRSGGTYAYLREAFGPRKAGRLLAFLFVWQFLFWAPLILASGYIGFAQYAAYLVPALGAPLPTHLLAIGVGVVTLGALYRAIPQIARTALLLGAVALATLLAVALAGLSHPHQAVGSALHATLSTQVALPALGTALIITLYDYAGYADVCALGDEVVAAARTIPRAVVLSIGFVGVAYILLNLGVVAALDPREIARSGNVASLVAERTYGRPFAVAITLAVLVTAFGSTYGNLLAASRVPFAAAREGDFLAPFARLHPRLAFPALSLLTIGLLALPASLFSLDAVIAALTAGIVLIQGVAQVIALFVVRARAPAAPFRVPLYPLPPLLALAGWLVLFASTGAGAIAFGLGTLAAGALVFCWNARRARAWPFTAAALAMALTLGGACSPVAAQTPSFGHALLAQRDGQPRLLVDGRPFFFWGGAFFYPRIPASQWRASMLAMRELGANTLDLYVPWNWHEPADGDFDFEGRSNPRRNLREVLRLGKELGFHFIVRPGPVIRNEWRNGGYPAWLLQRPEYDMPLHDVLEGRYPATATLQNARSDDAAAEWMRNGTHLRYASRWLQRALAEFRPYADLVLAVQLDDDQGAYIDNQTYPAPHLRAYLSWLEAQVRAVTGAREPVFINTYQLRVPASLPVWTMGNWYQSDAYAIGDHDRTQLDFSSALLRTNAIGPFAQSEFQAGWLAGPEDPAPRPADPANTELALAELLGWGANGVIDFPMQDTLAPFGWDAPFANDAYAWDAALPLRTGAGPQARYAPTKWFGDIVSRWGALLARTHRYANVALEWPAAYAPESGSALAARLQELLARCRARSAACELVDLAAAAPRGEIRTLVTTSAPGARPAAVRDRIAAFAARGGRLAGDVPAGHDDGALLLGTDASFFVATNWSAQPRAVRARTLSTASGTVTVPAFAVAPRSARLVVLGAPRAARDAVRNAAPLPAAPTPPAADSAVVRLGPGTLVRLEGLEPTAAGRAQAFRADVFGDGNPALVMQNDRLRVVIVPDAGARGIVLEDLRTAYNAFDATGAWRDDTAEPPAPSARDYIAKYTHAYPAGTYNRAYAVQILQSGERARVRVSYAMPDAPPGQRFERVLTLDAGEPRLVVDERIEGGGNVLSSLPPLVTGVPLEVPAGAADGRAAYASGEAFSVAWRAGDAQRVTWTPYRSTGSLTLALAAGRHRSVFALTAAATPDQARRFVEAERAWVAANPPDQR